tara:strand:+ start:193 stop:627 length:435 start_codon:yes stop_codon:yes gene_type:complete
VGLVHWDRLTKLVKARLGGYIFPLLWFSLAGLLIVFGLSEHVHYYVSVDQLREDPVRYDGVQFRLGGYVVPKSLDKNHDTISFTVSNHEQHITGLAEVRVVYSGGLPALFKEGKAMVADGRYISGVFYAREILAKHDENYQIPS